MVHQVILLAVTVEVEMMQGVVMEEVEMMVAEILAVVMEVEVIERSTVT